MSELTPGQEKAERGGRMAELPPAAGPSWTGSDLVISGEWAASRENRKTPWNMIPYAALSSVRRGDFGHITLSRPDGLAVDISTEPKASLEACTLLADGLSTNPAVAPAAAELLGPWLAGARTERDKEARRRHQVDPSGTTHTFYSMRGLHLSLGVASLLLSLGIFIGDSFAMAYPSSKWAQGASTSDYVWSIIAGLALVWLGIRLLRMGVRISSKKITVRGYLRTRTVHASDIWAVTLQPLNSDSGPRWIPQVELTGGKSFRIYSLDFGSARKPPEPGVAATIEEIQVLLGVADGISPPATPQSGSAAG